MGGCHVSATLVILSESEESRSGSAVSEAGRKPSPPTPSPAAAKEGAPQGRLDGAFK